MPSPCILYAEDEPDDAFFLELAFERAGLGKILQVVNNGQSALEYLDGAGDYADRTRFPAPDLVLLDINLPKKTGLEVLDWIRRDTRWKKTPVVMLTSSSHHSDMKNARSLAVSEYLLKPSNPMELVQFAHLLNDRWLAPPDSTALTAPEVKSR